MKLNQMLILLLMCLVLLIVVFASCSSGQSNLGVARIDEQKITEPAIKSATQGDPSSNIAEESASDTWMERDNLDTSTLTDEAIVTGFTACLRDYGFNVRDPELNADGTINLQGLRQTLFQDPKFQTKGQIALENCQPLLQGATFAQPPSAEDQIELEDTLLKFAQCLRDEGVDVSDPDFTNGARAGMGSILQGINIQSNMVQEALAACRESIFTGRTLGGRRE
jgi:hypothetical protein